MPGILWSQQQQLASAMAGLGDWEGTARSLHLHVQTLNVELLTEADEHTGVVIIIEWDEAHQEYSIRPAGA